MALALTLGISACGQSATQAEDKAGDAAQADTTAASATFEKEEGVRPRTIVTTDLECDDICALIHMLLYTNEIDLDGIVVTSSTYHWTGDGKHTQAEINDHTIGAEHKEEGNNLTEWRPMDLEYLPKLISENYAEVYPSLSANDERYPSPDELLSRVYLGNYEFEGDTRSDTEGSDFIKQCLLDDDERTLYLEAWGGSNTVARALMSIEEEHKDSSDWDTIRKSVSEKAILISFGDQDTTYEDYIAKQWPDLKHMYCVTAAYGYGMQNVAPLDVQDTFRPAWLKENIKFDHGALLEAYPLIGDGIHYEGEIETSQFGDLEVVKNSWLSYVGIDYQQYDFISEGDAPCFMYLIPVGLRGIENSTYGSWGGRMDDKGAIPEYDVTRGMVTDGYSAHRWLKAYQNDFAARADWCVKAYDECNHQPVVDVETADFEAQAGTTVELKGKAYDPDGDQITSNWFVYGEASEYDGESAATMDVWEHDVLETSFTIPADAKKGDVFNLVLEVTDDGEPALTRYAQVIVTVNKEAEPVEETAWQ